MPVDYLVPPDLAAALEMREAGCTVLAGGTDLYPQHVGRAISGRVVDLGGIASLRGIAETPEGFRLGALTRWTDVAAASLPPCFDGLRAAAAEVGSIQVQNAGTVGGNLCNASPAADGVPPLLTLDASVELTSVRGSRQLPLESFLTGYRETALRHDELLTAVIVPRGIEDSRSAFSKLGLRRYLVISVVMVAVVASIDGEGLVSEARIAVGACSPVARRLRSLESHLRGRPLGEVGEASIAEHLAMLAPIDDVRATADYRRHAAAVLVRRALARCEAVAA
ncbi:MAG TPA: FAD binding domain-containing protein [Actinomycetota bacterium]|nr:FAD binding domain-containing protein [Actinomycetota bacterium]